jgi:hypothetical protein
MSHRGKAINTIGKTWSSSRSVRHKATVTRSIVILTIVTSQMLITKQNPNHIIIIHNHLV